MVGVIVRGGVCDGTLLTCGGCDIVRGMCVPAHCLPVVGVLLSGVCVCRHITYLQWPLLAGPGDTDGSVPQHGQVPQPAEQRAHPAPCGQFPYPSSSIT